MTQVFYIGDRVKVKEGLADIGTVYAIEGDQKTPLYGVIFDNSKDQYFFNGTELFKVTKEEHTEEPIVVGSHVLLEATVSKIVSDTTGTVYYLDIVDSESDERTIKVTSEQLVGAVESLIKGELYIPPTAPVPHTFDYGDKVHVIETETGDIRNFRRGIIVGCNSSYYQSTYCVSFDHGETNMWYADYDLAPGWSMEVDKDENFTV